jgi:hypothetical protein
VVCDEPLYAHYLWRTGRDHPGAREVIGHGDTDWRSVVGRLTGPVPGGKAIFYQKHMAHHLLPGIDRAWLGSLTHAFLIRDPREMLTSLVEVLPDPTLEDTGLPQQVEIFERVERETGRIPPVIDARDLLEDPGGLLRRLCRALRTSFREEMLSWPPGRRDTDGIWAKHWYAKVEASTTFGPWAPKAVALPDRLGGLCDECLRYHDRLRRHRLRAERNDG